MLTREEILETERLENEHQARINCAFVSRHVSQEAWNLWSAACAEWHRSEFATDHLWLNETRSRMREGDREPIEEAILFLEVDPWYFRSGYLKEWLLDALKSTPLTEQDKVRLRRVILTAALGENRREFRRYCSLALKITTDAFEDEIERNIQERHPESKGKLNNLLAFIRKNKRHPAQ